MSGINQGWRRRYVRRLAVLDALVVLWATAGALIVRFGSMGEASLISVDGRPYVMTTLLLAAGWWAVLGIWGTRDPRILGFGTEEYRRLLSGSFWLFGFVALVSYVFQLETARGYMGIALPAGICSLAIARMLVRRLLRLERTRGESTAKVLIVGGIVSVQHLVRSLNGQPMAGYRPIGVHLPTGSGAAIDEDSLDLDILGYGATTDDVLAAIARCRPDAVAFSSGVPLSPRVIRELGWALADLNIRMIMAPALTDIAGPRIHTQPVAGLPLIHVSTPNLNGWQKLAKRFFDLFCAIGLIICMSPILMGTAILIRLDSPGPVIFKQTRVGVKGVPFLMFKFRSMVIDAESQLDELRHHNEGNTILFKLKTDPRVTKIGKIIRRFSVDELPQLFNVVNGTMSLVGPRPPLPNEVDAYEKHVHRRLLVRPGLTGLWQVSGRSLLSWEDTVRLDLYYVENWSLAGDIVILFKTLRAVVSRRGAY